MSKLSEFEERLSPYNLIVKSEVIRLAKEIWGEQDKSDDPTCCRLCGRSFYDDTLAEVEKLKAANDTLRQINNDVEVENKELKQYEELTPRQKANRKWKQRYPWKVTQEEIIELKKQLKEAKQEIEELTEGMQVSYLKGAEDAKDKAQGEGLSREQVADILGTEIPWLREDLLTFADKILQHGSIKGKVISEDEIDKIIHSYSGKSEGWGKYIASALYQALYGKGEEPEKTLSDLPICKKIKKFIEEKPQERMKLQTRRILIKREAHFSRGQIIEGNNGFHNLIINAIPEPYDFSNWTPSDLKDLADATNGFLCAIKWKVDLSQGKERRK